MGFITLGIVIEGEDSFFELSLPGLHRNKQPPRKPYPYDPCLVYVPAFG